MIPSQSRIFWSQYSSLPDDFLNDLIEENPQPASWNGLWDSWNPPTPSFTPSFHWGEALKALNLPQDRIHMGVDKGPLLPPFDNSNVSLLKESTKASILLLQVIDVLKNQEIKARDMTGEVILSVHSKVWNQWTFCEGYVILLQNVTVLPGHVLNVTINNVVRVFQDIQVV